MISTTSLSAFTVIPIVLFSIQFHDALARRETPTGPLRRVSTATRLSGHSAASYQGVRHFVYVASDGDSSADGTTPDNPVRTLEDAYDRLQYPGERPYDIVLLPGSGAIGLDRNTNSSVLRWTKSGTPNAPIRIYSADTSGRGLATVSGGQLRFEGAGHVSVSRLRFVAPVNTDGIVVSHSDYIEITYVRFIQQRSWGSGGATVYIGYASSEWDNLPDRWNPDALSEHVRIRDNLFEFTGAFRTGSHLWQGIYVSRGVSDLEITDNTIRDPPGIGVAFYHDFHRRVNVARNFVYMHPRTLYGLSIWAANTPSTIEDITFHENTVYGPRETNGNDCTGNRLTHFDTNPPTLCGSAVTWTRNRAIVAPFDPPQDPAWLGYDAKNVHAVVAGDFDDDNDHDDVAAFYSGGSGAYLHVFNREESGFRYHGGRNNSWWSHPNYPDSAIGGRVAVGDFDNDGTVDDIAVMLDLGGDSVEVDVFRSNGGRFQREGGTNNWWHGERYNARNVARRFLSGDFDQDGFHDDLAMLYALGNERLEIGVLRGDGGRFVYEGGSNNWYRGGLPAARIRNRVVSGDFDCDGYHDDIAMLYDLGGRGVEVEMFRAMIEPNSRSFKYEGGAQNWARFDEGFEVGSVDGLVVAGNFDGNSCDDVATLYGGEGRVEANMFLTTGTSFDYEGGSYAWWESDVTAADLVRGRLAVGNFDARRNTLDILGFYDYESIDGGVRTLVWASLTGRLEVKRHPWILDY